MTEAPFFSVVTPVYNPPVDVLIEMIQSVREQSFQDWELILVDDVSPDPQVREVLRRAAAEDSRLVVIEREVNGHIVKASNDGIERARGQFVVLVDHDDLLEPHAFRVMVEAIQAHPEVDYLYSDEDKLDDKGNFYDAFRKPDWSPERLRGQMYTSHLSVLRTSVVKAVGAFHEGFDGSQDHDLVLRVTEQAREVVHVPEVLYHWRVVPGSAAGDPDAKPYAWIAGRKAVQAHIDRVGIRGEVSFGRGTGTYRIDRHLDEDVLLSVVIPTRGGEGLVWGERRCFVVDAVRSVVERGGHDNVEVVVVYDTSTPAHVLEELRGLGVRRLTLVEYAKPFNFSEKCNIGVAASFGSVVLLLNDDIEISSPGFLPQLAAPLFESGVGATGARLLFPDNTIQHAGLVFYGNDYAHAFHRVPGDDYGPFTALTVNREVSALTGACLAMLRTTYDHVGGMAESLPVNYNDVDLSFKIRREGLRLVWLNEPTAYHFESQTRVAVVHPWEHEIMKRRWFGPDDDAYLPEVR
ncbi:glycosyltransferase family 2 protein [Sanguibacter antarcticus]|uniref:Glycosyltransferase involved in cell wall biosynthesis n=1 Tax=Sanguibacter antarcticus TaxID=372484 RepID=A0A2A9E2D1_9MICO|nr:glycosyltransferase [Sanguibacter antarcticus]PFG32515.1 glycosyltransferase involved in cell wall biosynthesis [Sanguibacter antarcticus]